MSPLISNEHWRRLQPNLHAIGQSSETERAIAPREALRILNRRRWIIVAATAVAIACAAAYLVLATPLYTATAMIVIDPHRAHLADDPNRQQISSFGSDDAMVESQALLITSPDVLRHVVDQLKLTSDPEFVPQPGLFARWLDMLRSPSPPSAQDARESAEAQAIATLQKKLKVSRDGKTFVIDISATSRNPLTAQKIANAAAEAYFHDQVDSRRQANQVAAGWLADELAGLKSRVQASDKAVEDFRTSHALVTTKGVTVNDQQLTDLNNQLIQAHVQTAEAHAKLQEVQDIVGKHGDPGTLTQALSSSVIQQLRTQYAEIARNVADLSSKFGPRHPKVVNAKAQLNEVHRLINQEMKRILDNVRASYVAAKSRESALQDSLGRLQSTSSTLTKDQVRLRELQREADANRTLYESFLGRYKQTTARENLTLSDSRIAAHAGTPKRPSYPKKSLVLVLAAFFGAGGGILLAFAVDLSDGRIKTASQAEDVTHLPNLAAVPIVGVRELARRTHRARSALSHYDPETTVMLPPIMQPPLMRYVLDEPMSLFAEAIRTVRLAIQRTGRKGGGKTITVSSAIDGEGKSTLAANLALSFAVAGARTILVDGDFRNPELSRSLCPNAGTGLVDVATGVVPLEQAIAVDSTTGLAVLPSPSWHKMAHVTEFAFSSAMSNLLAYLRGRYDFIVVDAPPLLPLADARALAEHADNIVVAVRWDATPKEVIVQAIKSLSPLSERLLGTVLTRVDMHRLRHYDYYQSSSYIQPYSYLGHPRIQPIAYSPESRQAAG